MEKLKMAELFIEIFSEEIPARMQLKAGENFSKLMVSGLKKEGLLCEKIIHHTGPRRLIFKADIPLKSPNLSGFAELSLSGFVFWGSKSSFA